MASADEDMYMDENLVEYYNTTFAYVFKNEILPYMIASDIVNMKQAVSKTRVEGSACATCGKIFYGHRYKGRLLQHCDSVNHKYL